VSEKKGRAFIEMLEDSIDIRCQLQVLFYEHWPSRAAAMPSQVKSNRSVARLCKVSPHVHVTSGMFAQTMNYDYRSSRLRGRLPPATKKFQAIHGRNCFC